MFMVLFLFLGMWRFSISIHQISKNGVDSLNETRQLVVGTIKNNPELTQKNQQYILQVSMAKDEHYFGNLLVFSDIYPMLQYGDKVKLECKLNKPEAIEDFSYDKYLAMKSIYSICYYPETRIISNNNGNVLFSIIYKFKNKFRESINKNLGEPSSGIVNAMILGDKKFLSDEVKLKFSKAGLSHIIAISGMHIGVFILGLGFLFFFVGFNRNISFYFILCFLVIYNILIGFPASAVRASFMGILILYAFKIGRLNKIYNSILLAATILVLINPMLIRYDLGFIFSFLALLGIVYFYPIIDSYFKDTNNIILNYSKDIIIISIAAQVLILPLIIKIFGVFSIISPLVNLFIIWTLPFILAGTIFGFLFSMIIPSLSFYLFLPVKLLLSYILFIVDFFINIPGASFQLDFFPKLFIYLYYLIIFSFILYRNYRNISNISNF